ncbi:hypothetical protein [Corynebacterium pilosum]|uniref:Uncharacterized protein n=1 Tax=Corynebacterium pilosum TaxID=35756 RepID=A0A376CMF2_9CORY|nr:hypothetical protein [Corynebacterium pilosum]STC69681.1 Uncharacterised protein [Corynebacterium pilosum]
MKGLDADVDAIRGALRQAQDDVSALRVKAQRDSPYFPVAAAGAGFAERGRRLAAALEQVQQGTIRRLDARLHHYSQIAEATDAIASAEADLREELSRHDLS